MAVELDELVVGDEPGAWAAAGFAVDDDGVVRIGAVRIRLAGREGGHRIRSWSLRGIEPTTTGIDGLETTSSDRPPCAPAAHPNGVERLDHLVLLSPDVARTTDALVDAGLDLRRSAEVDESRYGFAAVQNFFRIGEPVLELVGADGVAGEGPSGFFGLAYAVADLDALAARYGDALGQIKDAVQPGLRIATLRHRELDLSVATAFMGA